MSTLTPPPAPVRSEPTRTPPVRNGDHLTAMEFERRCATMPNPTKAELIDGVVFVTPPIGFDDHGGPHFDLISWLGLYRLATPGVRGGDNTTLRLPLQNLPQPDACMLIEPTRGGRVQIQDGYIVGGPELAAEVAATSANYDLHDKLDVYRRNGIQEYLVWRVFDRAIDWYTLVDGRYEPLPPAADGSLQSGVFPGLWLDPAALVRGDVSRVAAVARQGLASAEYTAFVARLAQAASRHPA